MRLQIQPSSFAVLGVLAVLAAGCESGGVGDPCTPEDEYQTQFSGFGVIEVNVESKSFQCETRVCLVNHFQGRVSCPYGQTEPGTACSTPDGIDPIQVAVEPQLLERRAEQAVYCSCRCDGPDPNARYCDCPSGFSCVELVEDLGDALGSAQLAGSYCIKQGSAYDTVKHSPQGPTCDATATNCEDT